MVTFLYLLETIAYLLRLIAIIGAITLCGMLIYFLAGIIIETIQKWGKPHVDRKYNIVRYESKVEKFVKILLIIGIIFLIGFLLFCIAGFILLFFRCLNLGL